MKDQPSAGSIAIASIFIFAVAVALRVPSCYESFWVDELHSAWCAWDSLIDVASRADLGHQSPIYFVGLWFWKQIAGDSEVGLRLSSVLAVSISCVILTVGVASWNRSLFAGATAGSILAIESNSIFFGTELRPFAFVILFASIASVCFVRLVASRSRHEARLAWIGMIAAILLAVLCQPTSLGVLVFLPVSIGCIWLFRAPRELFRITLTDVFVLVTTTGVAFALWSITLSESWVQRGTWAAFASATSIKQVWQIWDWTWLWCVPVGLLVISRLDVALRSACSELRRGKEDAESAAFAEPKTTLLVAMIAVVGTFGYWFVAWNEWLPLWHRRYFTAVLPLFGLIGGGAVGAVSQSDRLRKLAPVVAMGLVVGLMWRQNMHRTLPHYPVAFAVRGEDWRAAIDWVRNEADPKDSIYLEGGLIEGNKFLVPPDDDDQIRYFLYPVSGPYQLNQPVSVINSDLALPFHDLYDDTKQIFLIVRRPANRIPINPTQWGWVHGNRYVDEVKSFGNVTVIPMPTLSQE